MRLITQLLLLNSSGVSVPTNSAAPVISGLLPVGSTLTVTPGTWTGAPVLTYQWQRGGVDIGGATNTTYVDVSADAGQNVTALEIPNGNRSLAVSSNTLVPYLYGSKILTIQSANLLFDYPFSETSGTAAVNAQGNTALNALYKNGVALNAGTFTDGTPYPNFDGTDDCVDAYTAALAAVINGDEGTFACWVLPDAATLASTTSVYLANLTDTGVTNGVSMLKTTTANQFTFRRIVGGSTLAVTATMSNPVWTHFAMTWSVLNNRLRGYISGASVGTPQTAATMTLTLGAARAAIGAANNSGALRWKGGLKYPMLWTKELTAAEILSLATIP